MDELQQSVLGAMNLGRKHGAVESLPAGGDRLAEHWAQLCAAEERARAQYLEAAGVRFRPLGAGRVATDIPGALEAWENARRELLAFRAVLGY
jgi:hypothetical protein